MTASHTICSALRIARSIIAGGVEPYGGAADIWRQVAETAQRDIGELGAFVGLASEWQDHPELRDDLDEDIRTAARALLERYGEE